MRARSTSRRRPVLAASGVLLALAVAAAVAIVRNDGPDHQAVVLGAEVSRPDPATGAGGVPPAAEAAVDPAPAPATDAEAGSPVTHTVMVERGSAFFSYRPPDDSVAGSAMTITRGERAVLLGLAGTPNDGEAVVVATVENATDRPVSFVGGLRVTIGIYRDGALWQTIELSDSSVTGLATGGRVEVRAKVPLDAAGDYELTGRLTYTDA